MRYGGGARNTYGGKERYIQGFNGKNLREIGHLEDPNVDGRITIKWIFRNLDVWHGLD